MHILHNVPESWRQRIENKPNSDFTKITLIKNNWAPPQYQWDTSKKNKCIFQDVGVKVYSYILYLILGINILKEHAIQL